MRLMFILGLNKTIEKQISSSSDSENSVKSNDKNIKNFLKLLFLLIYSPKLNLPLCHKWTNSLAIKSMKYLHKYLDRYN